MRQVPEVDAIKEVTRAYGLIAHAIAQHVFVHAKIEEKQHRSVFLDATRPIYHHNSMSAFEAAAENLWQLRILKPLDEKGG
jgi:hypothetical protein